MRLFPQYWADSHPAFPRPPVSIERSEVADKPLKAGLLGGGVAGVAALLNRYVPGQALKYVGVFGIFTATFAIFEQGVVRARVKRDVYPLLEAEGVPLPRFRLFERTKTWSTDDSVILGCIVGFARGLVPPRLKYSLSGRGPLPDLSRLDRVLRLVGCTAVGGAIAPAAQFPTWIAKPQAEQLAESQKSVIAKLEYAVSLAKAKDIYQAKTGRTPPAWLYPDFSVAIQKSSATSRPGRWVGARFPMLGDTTTTSEEEDEDDTLVEVEDETDAESLPVGTAPHAAVLRDGKIEYLPARDYRWEGDDIEEKLTTLREHVQWLEERRANLLKDAQYLWLTIAEKERLYAADKSDDSSESRRRLRAKLELLSSIHYDTFVSIAALDWMLQDTQKMMLQAKSNGSWKPKAGSDEIKSYAPKNILRQLVEHKVNTEQIRAQLATSIMPENSDDSKNIERTIEDNDIATGELIEEYEERCADPSAFDDISK